MRITQKRPIQRGLKSLVIPGWYGVSDIPFEALTKVGKLEQQSDIGDQHPDFKFPLLVASNQLIKVSAKKSDL